MHGEYPGSLGDVAPEASGALVGERGYPKAVVITDGYADMTEEHAEALKKRKVSILTVISRPSQPKRLLRRSRLGDGDEECVSLAPFGPVMKLEDVVEAFGFGFLSRILSLL